MAQQCANELAWRHGLARLSLSLGRAGKRVRAFLHETQPHSKWRRPMSTQLRLHAARTTWKRAYRDAWSRAVDRLAEAEALALALDWQIGRRIELPSHPHALQVRVHGPSQVCRSLTESGGMQRMAKPSLLYSRTVRLIPNARRKWRSSSGCDSCGRTSRPWSGHGECAGPKGCPWVDGLDDGIIDASIEKIGNQRLTEFIGNQKSEQKSVSPKA